VESEWAGSRKNTLLASAERDIHVDLVRQCRLGKRSAQQELYRLYAGGMFNTAFRILKHEEDAKDVLQESFIEVFRKLDTYREESSFGSWFKRIVINKSLNQLRQKRRIVFEEELEDRVEEEEKPYRFDYEVKDVKRAMNGLPDGYKLVFDLYMFEGLSHKEIAQELKISEATSKSQLSRSKVKLRELLTNPEF
jgi:RNA polymerase sigma-70 factor (ECF subfamily)